MKKSYLLSLILSLVLFSDLHAGKKAFKNAKYATQHQATDLIQSANLVTKSSKKFNKTAERLHRKYSDPQYSGVQKLAEGLQANSHSAYEHAVKAINYANKVLSESDDAFLQAAESTLAFAESDISKAEDYFEQLKTMLSDMKEASEDPSE